MRGHRPTVATPVEGGATYSGVLRIAAHVDAVDVRVIGRGAIHRVWWLNDYTIVRSELAGLVV